MTLDRLADELLAEVDVATELLRCLSPEQATQRPAADRWSIQEVIGHLVDSAANNHHRFVRAQSVREFKFLPYQQNEWVASQHYNEVSWPDLIELWRLYNHHLAHVIRHVDQTKLKVPCLIESDHPVTLQFLLQDYLVHMQHHLRIVEQRIQSL